jgi:hypothetical protein
MIGALRNISEGAGQTTARITDATILQTPGRHTEFG